MRSKPSPRLYVLLARAAPVGVVFRRGPSKQVLVLSWNTETHEIWKGQWFKGRIYEHRCDLSPSGEKLIYFAANQRAPMYSWTAVSRPPFLTALALWPKGDAWGGGGLFENERTIALNHSPPRLGLEEGFRVPATLTVAAIKEWAGRGEDDPIWSHRMERDGWVLKHPGRVKENEFGAKLRWEYPEPIIWAKANGRWTIEMRILGIHETEGPWYVTEHRVLDAAGEVVIALGRSDWADWSQSGEVLFAKEGRLYRIPAQQDGTIGTPIEVADLRELRFEEVPPPGEATVWSGRAPRGDLLT